MPRRLFFKLAGVFFLMGCSFGFSTQAWAGFQWIAPAEPLSAANTSASATPSQSSSAVSVMPLTSSGPDSTSPEVITPIIIEGSPSKSPALSSGGQEIPIYSGPVPPMQPTLPVTERTNSSLPEEIVHGFAKSVPLAVALRQILPPGYAFSID